MRAFILLIVALTIVGSTPYHALAGKGADIGGLVVDNVVKVGETAGSLVNVATFGAAYKVWDYLKLPTSMQSTPDGTKVSDTRDTEVGMFRYYAGGLGAYSEMSGLGGEGEFIIHAVALDNLYTLQNYTNRIVPNLGRWKFDNSKKEIVASYYAIQNNLQNYFWHMEYSAYVGPSYTMWGLDTVIAHCNSVAAGACPQIVPYQKVRDDILNATGEVKIGRLVKKFYSDESHNLVYDIGDGKFIIDMTETYDDISEYIRRWSNMKYSIANEQGQTYQLGSGDFNFESATDDEHRGGLVKFNGFKHRMIYDSKSGLLAGISVDPYLIKVCLVNIMYMGKDRPIDDVLKVLHKWQWSINRRVLISNADWESDMCKTGTEGNPEKKSEKKGASMASDFKEFKEHVDQKMSKTIPIEGEFNAVCRISPGDRRGLVKLLSNDLVSGAEKAAKLIPIITGGKVK